MKMLTEERQKVNLSLSMNLDLMKSQLRQSRDHLHNQICEDLNPYHPIDPFSASQTYPVYLKIILQASPKLFYGVMLLPDGKDLTSSELSTEADNAVNPGEISEKQEYNLPEGSTFCRFSANFYPLASPEVIVQLYLFPMDRKLLILAIYGEEIIALGMNHYLIESLFFEHIGKILRAVPTIESNRKLCNIDPFVFEKLYNPFDHIFEYLRLGCVGSALFANRPYRKRDDPISYLDSYGDDVLAFDNLFVSPTIPAVGEAYNLAKSIYDRIINRDCDPHSRKSRRALTESLLYQLRYLLAADKEEHPPELKDTPRMDRSIDSVLVYIECLGQLIRGEYVENVAACQHQKYLYTFLLVLSELPVKKYLKWLERFDKFILHFGSPYMGYFSIFIPPPYKETLFFPICQELSSILPLIKNSQTSLLPKKFLKAHSPSERNTPD